MRVDIRHPDNSSRVLFSHKELACKSSGQVILADGFADKLTMLRVAFGQPMTVNSCCRSTEHNRDIGGHWRSLHCYDEPTRGLNGCAAIDIRTPDIVYARLLVETALAHYWSVGVSRAFVHLDRRDFAGLPAGMFGYG